MSQKRAKQARTETRLGPGLGYVTVASVETYQVEKWPVYLSTMLVVVGEVYGPLLVSPRNTPEATRWDMEDVAGRLRAYQEDARLREALWKTRLSFSLLMEGMVVFQDQKVLTQEDLYLVQEIHYRGLPKEVEEDRQKHLSVWGQGYHCRII